MINLTALTLGTAFICSTFFWLGYVSRKYQIKFFLWSIAFIQMLTLPAIYFVAEQEGSILPILRVNMWVLVIVGFGIGIFVLFNHSINTMDPLQGFEGQGVLEGEDHMKKDHMKGDGQ